MLHPNQFQVNEAWIAFKLNDKPIHTEGDGKFDVVGLMDAASCFILGSSTVPSSVAEPTRLEARGLLEQGRAHKKQLPKTLFIPAGQPAEHLALEAVHQGILVVRVPEDQLLAFIAEARDGFREHFSMGGPW